MIISIFDLSERLLFWDPILHDFDLFLDPILYNSRVLPIILYLLVSKYYIFSLLIIFLLTFILYFWQISPEFIIYLIILYTIILDY